MCAVLNLLPDSLRRAARSLGLLALLASSSAWGQVTQANGTDCPNAPKNLPLTTYDEQVQYLATPDCRTGLLDSIQFIPLSRENENYYASFGFWIRERGEYVSNPNWSGNPPGNIYQMQRYFLHTDVHLGERFRFFGELASSLLDGRNGGPRPSLEQEKMYVHQGCVDLGLC